MGKPALREQSALGQWVRGYGMYGPRMVSWLPRKREHLQRYLFRYMANDMQFFLTSPFIIFALWSSRHQPWKRNMGLALLGLLLVIFTAIPTVLGVVKDYPFSPMLFNGVDQSIAGDYMMNFYVVPWCRSIALACTLYSLPIFKQSCPQVPAVSCRPRSWLPYLQDAGAAQTFP